MDRIGGSAWGGNARGRAAVLIAMLLIQPCAASLFVVAICRDGIVAVADSRITLQIDGVPKAYADGMEKLVPLADAVVAQAGHAFVGDERFDTLFARFYQRAGKQPIQQVLPEFLASAASKLTPKANQLLDTQRIAIGRFERGNPVICMVSSRMEPSCIPNGAFASMNGVDFSLITQALPQMDALGTAVAARAAMERFIRDRRYHDIAGGRYSAVVLTRKGLKRIWSIADPIGAMNSSEFMLGAREGRIRFTAIPPTTLQELRVALERELVR